MHAKTPTLQLFKLMWRGFGADCLAGMEVGHYAGCVRMWRALQQQQPGSIPAKVERSIAAMEECLLQYPLYKPQVSLSTPGLNSMQGRASLLQLPLGGLV
jgi:hypothetical protein